MASKIVPFWTNLGFKNRSKINDFWSFGASFWELKSLILASWEALGAQTDPKQKKKRKKAILLIGTRSFWDHFLSNFSMIFGLIFWYVFWITFGSILAPFWKPK